MKLESRSRYHNAVTLTVADAVTDAVTAALRALPDVAAIEARPSGAAQQRLTVTPRDGVPILEQVQRAGRDGGWTFDQLFVESGHLDEVFRTITTTAGGAGEVTRT